VTIRPSTSRSSSRLASRYCSRGCGIEGAGDDLHHGSCRDVAAAFNRQPDLLKRKVKAVYFNVGRGPGEPQKEWNVDYDRRHSFACSRRAAA